MRTNNFRNLAKDLFIPALTRSAVKIDSLCFNTIFIGFFLLVLDILPCLPEFFTLIPRAIYNSIYPKNKDPFYLYLKSQGISDYSLKQDFVYGSFKWIENDNGRQVKIFKESYIGFIALPELIDFRPSSYSCRG